MSSQPLLILFLSTGNAARSILAEALLNAKGSERFVARSAGYAPLTSVHPETLSLLHAHRYETASLHTKDWRFFAKASERLQADVVITLSEEARVNSAAWPGQAVKAHWAVDDPLSAERPDIREWKFRKGFATLDARISALVRSRPVLSACELLLQLKDVGMVV